MTYLEHIENESIFIIREAYRKSSKMAMLWSIGKDSTVMLWLVRKAFLDRIPFPVVHIDTSFKFAEMIKFRDEKAKEWGFNLIVERNEAALKNNVNPNTVSKMECCTALKTNTLKQAVKKFGFDALLVGIRRDEHGIRAKERVFSPRNNDFIWDYGNQPVELWNHTETTEGDEDHVRVHPLLHWTEQNIWEYIKAENIPIVSQYFAKDKKRYRSIGCESCCSPIDSNAKDLDEIIHELKSTSTYERAGRAQDKESAYMMQKLRSLGYL